MSSLKLLKSLDNLSKKLVFGYVRKVEKEFNISAVPLLILYKILGYFYLYEYFEKCGDDLNISDHKMTVTKISEVDGHSWADNNAYGSLWFKSKGNEIATWKFKINKMGDENHEIYFALVSKDIRLNKDAYNSKDKPMYSLSNEGEDMPFYGEGDYHFPEFTLENVSNDGDEVSIRLNTKNRSIKWQIGKENEYEMLFSGIEQEDNISYKLAISLHSITNSISLIDFECTIA